MTTDNPAATTLLNIVSRLDAFDDELTIYARKPWTAESVAILALEPDEGGLPSGACECGFAYFIEMFVAAEILGDWSEAQPTPPSDQEKCDLLIHYATYDA